jgi:hypothetical protein
MSEIGTVFGYLRKKRDLDVATPWAAETSKQVLALIKGGHLVLSQKSLCTHALTRGASRGVNKPFCVL